MPDTIATRLAAALKHPADYEMLEVLGNFDSRFDGIPFAERPEPLALFGRVFNLHTRMVIDGVWKFFAEDDADDFAGVRKALGTIKAKRALALLDAVAKLFPRGRVPANAADRFEVLERLEARYTDAGKTDPVYALQEKYADAADTMAAAMRAWATKNRTKLVASLEAIPAPGKPAPTLIEAMTEGLATLEALVNQKNLDDREAAALLRPLAKAAGLLPWRDRGADPRYVAFLKATTRFGKKEWITVAERGMKHARKIDAARDAASDLRKLVQGRIVKEASFADAMTDAMRHPLRHVALDTLRALPTQVTRAGKPLGLVKNANRAMITATIVMASHDWMMLTPEGVAAARTAYAPFEGLAPCPELAPPTPVKARRARK